jgi:hypothetical protein
MISPTKSKLIFEILSDGVCAERFFPKKNRKRGSRRRYNFIF